MSLGIFKKENLISAWNAYFAYNVPDLYPLLVGHNTKAQEDYAQYSELDSIYQSSFVNETCNDPKFGMGIFSDGGSPADGYMDPNSHFCHAKSNSCNINNIAHRLYFNIGPQRIGFARALTYLCVERNIPFYFKWSKDGARADNIVIYLEQDQIAPTCKAIQDIAELHPDLTQSNRDLPMSAEDCGWFGYGVEDHDHTKSFSRKVTNARIRAFDDICKSYDYSREKINSVISNPELSEQFVSYMEYMVAQRFEMENIPTSLNEQLPAEIKQLMNLREYYRDQEMNPQ